MRVLVCGDRHWTDLDLCQMVLSWIGPNDTVICGMAKGADMLALFAATENGAKAEEYPADWTKLGRAAGPIRNRQMLTEGKPDLVIAFHDDLSASKGTADMVGRAKKAGIPVVLISHG